MNAQERERLRELSLAEKETGGFFLAGAKVLADGLAGGEGKAERIDCKIEKFRVTKIYNIPIWWDGWSYPALVDNVELSTPSSFAISFS